MANNFRIVTTNYISKDGDDADSGLTADLPKATLTRYANEQAVGCGVYKGAITLNTTSNAAFYADGLVKILATANLLADPNDNSNDTELNSSSNRGGLFIFDLGGFTFKGERGHQYFDAIFQNGTYEHINAATGGNEITDCIFDCLIDMSSSTASFVFDGCQFFNNTNLMNSMATKVMKNCYVDEATIFSGSAYFATPATDFINNNFRGQISVGGTLYELKKDKDGNAIDPNPAVADLVTIDAAVYTNGNFAQDPLYLNIEKRDYWSVTNASPNLFAGDLGVNHIGNVQVADVYKVTDTEFSTGTITGLSLSSGDFIVDSVSGDVVSIAIQVASIAQILQPINFALALQFNSDETKATSENQDVTISDNYATLTAGANPRRLTFEMRWSDADAVPVVSADWTNQLYLTAGDYGKFEQFRKPMIDPAANCNGNPLYTSVGAVGIKAKWVQFKISMFDGIG